MEIPSNTRSLLRVSTVNCTRRADTPPPPPPRLPPPPPLASTTAAAPHRRPLWSIEEARPPNEDGKTAWQSVSLRKVPRVRAAAVCFFCSLRTRAFTLVFLRSYDVRERDERCDFVTTTRMATAHDAATIRSFRSKPENETPTGLLTNPCPGHPPTAAKSETRVPATSTEHCMFAAAAPAAAAEGSAVQHSKMHCCT